MKRLLLTALALLLLLPADTVFGQSMAAGSTVLWPTRSWPAGPPAGVGLEAKTLASLDADVANGKYMLIDSMQVFRCGREVFARKYTHDYGRIYAEAAKTKGTLNARRGRYNYLDPDWHPFYQASDMHTMQSVTKTITSVIYGVAVTRGDFKTSLNTPVLNYFDVAKVKNVDERKRRMTLKHVLTMTTGLNWNEEVPYVDPRNDSYLMEVSDDWVQYAIDRPMAEEPGTVFNYSGGATELLAYIFRKETGQDIETYAEKYLFRPLGIRHYWKRNDHGFLDTEGGLYLSGSDLAKIGYLYLQHGKWQGKQIVSREWVNQSVTPVISARKNFQYGYQWWLYPMSGRVVWLALGFGGQRLIVFPEENMITVFTGWEILKSPASTADLINRLLPAIRQTTCPADSY